MRVYEFIAVWLVLVVVALLLGWIGGYSIYFGVLLLLTGSMLLGGFGLALVSFGLWVVGHAMHRATQVFDVRRWVADLEDNAQSTPDTNHLFRRR